MRVLALILLAAVLVIKPVFDLMKRILNKIINTLEDIVRTIFGVHPLYTTPKSAIATDYLVFIGFIIGLIGFSFLIIMAHGAARLLKLLSL